MSTRVKGMGPRAVVSLPRFSLEDTVKYGHPDSPEGQAKLEEERTRAQQVERAGWAELREVYRRAKAIATEAWGAELSDLAHQQERVAMSMNRHEPPIVVPLFTHRDRVYFLKEATVALLIEAGKRNLRGTPNGREQEQANMGVLGVGTLPSEATITGLSGVTAAPTAP